MKSEKNIYDIKVQNTNEFWATFKKGVEATEEEISKIIDALLDKFPKYNFGVELIFSNKKSNKKAEQKLSDDQKILMLLKEEQSGDETDDDFDEDENIADILSPLTSGASDEDNEDLTDFDDLVYEDEENKKEFPHAWWRRAEFVSRHGTYFAVGKVVEENFRKFPPSDY